MASYTLFKSRWFLARWDVYLLVGEDAHEVAVGVTLPTALALVNYMNGGAGDIVVAELLLKNADADKDAAEKRPFPPAGGGGEIDDAPIP